MMLSKILTRAGDLGAVHALDAGPDLQGLQLLIGDVLESLVEQVDAMLQVVAAQAFSEVVERTQIEVAFVQIMQAQGIAHLQVKEEMLIQFFIAPAMGRFEDLQSNQPVYGYIGTGWVIDK